MSMISSTLLVIMQDSSRVITRVSPGTLPCGVPATTEPPAITRTCERLVYGERSERENGPPSAPMEASKAALKVANRVAEKFGSVFKVKNVIGMSTYIPGVASRSSPTWEVVRVCGYLRLIQC